jgi:hypothetical protein
MTIPIWIAFVAVYGLGIVTGAVGLFVAVIVMQRRGEQNS